jgi:hypothetical protein
MMAGSNFFNSRNWSQLASPGITPFHEKASSNSISREDAEAQRSSNCGLAHEVFAI